MAAGMLPSPRRAPRESFSPPTAHDAAAVEPSCTADHTVHGSVLQVNLQGLVHDSYGDVL